MIRFLIHRPVAVIMIYVALILLGIVAAIRIPVSPLPDIEIPEITVHINKGNSSAVELENTIIQNLRTQLFQVPNIEDISSETKDDYAIIHLRFNYGTDINYAFIEVNEKIDLAMNSFPRGLERPRVVKASATDIPVFFINVTLANGKNASSSTENFLELSEFTEQIIKRRLEQLQEIAFVDISGLSYPQVSITPNVVAMKSLNLSEEDFRQVIENNNISYGSVTAMDGILQYNLRFSRQMPLNVEDIRNISFKHNGRVFKLNDIADVAMVQKTEKGLFVSNNNLAVSLAIFKQADTKLSDLRKKMGVLLSDFKTEYPNLRFEQAQDQTELLQYSITSLKQDLLMGGLLAFLMLFLFMKNLSAPLLILITIPTCLIIIILFFNLLHISLNIISLSGLILGVGLMIDNSIIVIDNITQHKEKNTGVAESCVIGTLEIIRPLTSSVLTTCSVFMPLIFLSGISGALFYDQALAIIIGLFISLIVSITLLPTLYRLFYEKKTTLNFDFFEKYGITIFERVYEKGFNWVFKHKVSSIIIAILLVICNIFIFKNLKKEKLPPLEQKELVINIDWNKNITVNENRLRVYNLIKIFNGHMLQSSAMIGEQQYLLSKEQELSSSESQIYIQARSSKSLQIIKERLSRYMRHFHAIASLKVSEPKSIFERVFGETETDLIIQISQRDNTDLPSAESTHKIIGILNKKFPGIYIPPVPVQQTAALIVDLEKLMVYHLSTQQVYQKFKNVLNNNEIGVLQNGQGNVPIMLTDRVNDLDEIIREMTVKDDQGNQIPISGFVKLIREDSYKAIDGGKNGKYIALRIATNDPEKVMAFFKSDIVEKFGLSARYSGSHFSNGKLIKEMAIVLMVAILLLYFILAAQFESLIQPIIVLLELPISMSGALLMLFIFKASINLISLIGFIVMCGIIINDSILKIDTINNLRRNEKYPLMEAIKAGGKRRLKSIVMTAMTTILSVVPFLFGTDMGSLIQRPLSLALIGGMLIGTPVSLYLIPLVYWFYYKRSEL
jgi:multidrug efflux pump subunit AcrB